MEENISSSSNAIESSASNYSGALTYDAIFSGNCKHLPWTSDLFGTPSFSFIQLYDYLVICTLKFKHILLKSTSYKKLKAFQFFYEGSIKKIEIFKDEKFLFLCACKGFNEKNSVKDHCSSFKFFW